MLSRWDGEGRNLVPVSVNVSMTDIESIDVARVLGDLLDRFSIDARLLQVEITESAIAHNMDVVEETIRDLHARGIAVLMDDFGSAYSSLNMLKDINVDAIKLDMKFVDLNADNAAKGLKIIESVIDMAYQLRLSIIAEGAQTAEQVSKCVSWDACTSKDIISTVRSLWERWRICWNTARMTSISGISPKI